MSSGAYAYLEKYNWPGNVQQLVNFCHRLVLLTPHRNIDEAFVRRQLELYDPIINIENDKEQVIVFKDRNAIRISETLKKYGGNRISTAQELGISKTTLWRLIKKYGIGADFSY
jgi:DNA-binding NtrC family response regulator